VGGEDALLGWATGWIKSRILLSAEMIPKESPLGRRRHPQFFGNIVAE
jgi:hypothetical protein